MKCETLNYLTKDLISLYQIISKMDENFSNNYIINITHKPTIAPLAFTILSSDFMDKSSCIPKTRGALDNA